MTEATKVKVGQLWLPPIAKTPVCIMAVADGYAMVRVKKDEPYILTTAHIAKLYERIL